MSVRRRSSQALVMTILMAQFVACGSDGPTGMTGPVARVTVTPLSAHLGALRVATQFQAVARGAAFNPLSGKTFAWSSSDVGIATVSSSGLVTAIAFGGATITATTEGVQGSASLTVLRPFAYVTNRSSNEVSVLAPTNTVVATVPVGVAPGGVAITPDGAFAYVTNLLTNDVSVIATSTSTVVATVPVDSAPQSVAITPDGAFAYVTHFVAGGKGISVIATSTNTVSNHRARGRGPV